MRHQFGRITKYMLKLVAAGRRSTTCYGISTLVVFDGLLSDPVLSTLFTT
jgi:hypothetical protein